MADIKVHVDMSELDAAAAKAERILGMLDEIERRIGHLNDVGSPGNLFAPLAGNVRVSSPQSPPPPKSKR